jgi:hypothetical protein
MTGWRSWKVRFINKYDADASRNERFRGGAEDD